MTQHRKERLRAVVVVNSANPRSTGSVALIGYRIAAGIDELTDATFVFHSRHRADLAEAFPADRVVYAGSQRLAQGLRRIANRFFPEFWGPTTIIEFLDYLVFDIDSFRKTRRIIKKERADFLLRVTPASYRFASLLAYLPIPVFTGPHNGGMHWPAGFSYLAIKEKSVEGVRFLGDIMHKIYRDTGRYAGIFVAHELCARTVDQAYHDKVIIIAENAVDKLGEPSPWSGDANRLLYVGRLVPFKAIDVILRGLARLPTSVHLTLVGEGPLRHELEALAVELGVRDRCEFVGFIPHDDLEKFYANAGVFVFPSVRESGGMVVLEAMSHALPCIVANWGGPPIYTQDTGIQLSVDSPRALEDELVSALSRLLDDPAEGRRVGTASREVITGEYIWSSKAELLLDMIRERIGVTQATTSDASTPGRSG